MVKVPSKPEDVGLNDCRSALRGQLSGPVICHHDRLLCQCDTVLICFVFTGVTCELSRIKF